MYKKFGLFHKAIALCLAPIMVVSCLSGFGSKTVLADTKSTSYSLKGLTAFELADVQLMDEYYINAAEKDINYLLSFEPNKLLAGFRVTAKLDTKGAFCYSGWENSLIGGHTLGHYLTACAQAYQAANTSAEQKKELLSMMKKIVQGLKECQDAVGTGFVFGSKVLDPNNIELQFDNVESNKTNIFTQAWVPWYTMHKLIAGTISVAQLKDSNAKEVAKEALSIAKGLGDWTYNRTSKWSAGTQYRVLSIEYGGMNDCLYDLYRLTKDENHAKAAHTFDQTQLFERVKSAKSGASVLNNLHANTTIPKFMGALNRYITYKDDPLEDVDVYLEYAKAFWELVVNDHTYITGGNSEWEHFGKDDVLDAERTNCNNETCNVYNMLKMSKQLFLLTGDVKYADYYENAFLNSIMSSQNPDTGMTTYFQPMATGYFKVFGDNFTRFWCCTGSGMENFTKLGESFYYHTEDTLVVNQYISSKLTWSKKKVTLTQETQIPETDTARFTIKTSKGANANITLAFRLPDWLAKSAVIKVNGKKYSYKANKGYAFVSGPFKNGTKLEVKLPMEVKAYSLPDNASVYGFKYGPVVLSALLGTKDMVKSSTGMSVTTPGSKLVEKSYVASASEKITVKADTLDSFITNINKYMVRDKSANGLAFKLINTDANLTFVQHYSQYTERYGIYWNFTASNSVVNPAQALADKKSARLDAYRLDTVQPGYGQYENDALHNMKEYKKGSTGDTSVGTSRYANAGGSFSYRMVVDTKNGTNLIATFRAEDKGKTLKIKVKDTVVYEKVLQSQASSGEYEVLIPLPKDVLASNAEEVNVDGKKVSAVTFTFEGAKDAASARLCQFLYSVKAFDTNSELKKVTSDVGTFEYNNSKKKYSMTVTGDSKETTIKFGIASAYGYVTVNGEVIDDKAGYKLKLTKKNNELAIRVYAEDHQTFTDYTIEVIKEGEVARENVAQDVTYFVDCGDHNPATLSEGDLFGTHNSVTEQIYGKDEVTGYQWGLVDDPTDKYKGASLSAGLYTSSTWCYEQNAGSDGLDKTKTNRYTKNQFESNIDRHIDYAFELENGTYTVEVGFANPWACSNKPSVYANFGKDDQTLLIDSLDLASKTTATAKVTVQNKQLTLNFKSKDKAINVTYIKISPVK